MASTKNAKLGYFRAEAEWYGDHAPTGSRAKSTGEFDDLKTALDKLPKPLKKKRKR